MKRYCYSTIIFNVQSMTKESLIAKVTQDFIDEFSITPQHVELDPEDGQDIYFEVFYEAEAPVTPLDEEVVF